MRTNSRELRTLHEAINSDILSVFFCRLPRSGVTIVATAVIVAKTTVIFMPPPE